MGMTCNDFKSHRTCRKVLGFLQQEDAAHLRFLATFRKCFHKRKENGSDAVWNADQVVELDK